MIGLGRGRRPTPRLGDRGQSTVELALLLPLVVGVVLIVVQVGVLVRTRLAVVTAARDAARVAAVDGDRNTIRDAAVTRLGDRPTRVVVSGGTAPGSIVEVTVHHRAPSFVSLFGGGGLDLTITERASMRVEDRPGRAATPPRGP